MKSSKFLTIATIFLVVALDAKAQSTVTLYGIIDEAVVLQSNSRIAAGNAPTGGYGTGKSKVFLDATSGLSGSRWGLKGTENLGGGLSVIFQLENGLNLNNGALGQGGLEFGRQAYVGLNDERLGKITLGRQYDSVVDFIGPLTLATRIGSSYAAPPGDLYNTSNAQRVNNAIKYTSPRLNGLLFDALYSFGGVSGSMARNQIYSVGSDFLSGPIRLSAAFLKVNQPNVSFFSNSAIAANTLGTSTTSISTPVYSGYANANSYQVAAAGGQFSTGPVTLSAAYLNAQFRGLGSSLSNAGNGVPAGKASGNAIFNTLELNVISFITPALQIGAAYSFTRASSVAGLRDATARTSAGSGGANYNQFAISSDYALSKRTDAYAMASLQLASGTDSTGGKVVAAIDTLTPSANNRQAVLRVGLRHKF